MHLNREKQQRESRFRTRTIPATVTRKKQQALIVAAAAELDSFERRMKQTQLVLDV